MKILPGSFNTKFRTVLLPVFALLLSAKCTAQLSGTYTIDPNGGPFPNFISIYAALDSLDSQGIDSAVVFNMADGNYYGNYYLPQITGASAVKTITFHGNETDSTKVRLYHNQTGDGGLLFLLDNAAHYVFRKMTIEPRGNDFARVFYTSYTHNIGITIENCLLKGESVGGVNRSDLAIIFHRSNEGTSNRICYRNNYFANGSFGIYLHAFGGEYNNVEISGNIFRDQYDRAIQVNNGHGMRIHNNTFYLTNTSYEAIYIENCMDAISIRGNRIVKTAGSSPGIYMAGCYGKGTVDRGILANNFISVGGNSTANGIFMINCRYQGVYHNSVNISSVNTGSSAFYAEGGQHIEVKNNVFSNPGGGYAYYTDNTDNITASDHNDYFSLGEYLANWGTSKLATVEALRTANGDDVHSVSVHPRFSTETDLHTNTYWLDGLGISGTGIATDIDGETRSDPPDIGADEFDPVPPLSGTYKIGGASAHYSTIKEAFDDLQVKGIWGPTRFEIRNDEYNELIGLVNEIPGASAEDSIVFTSESGNPDDVILHYSTDISKRVILMLSGVGYLTLRDISIAATGMVNGMAMYLIGDCHNINILNNRFSSENTADNILQITQGKIQDILVENNSFSKGLQAIYVSGTQSNYSTNIRISGNTFSGSLNNAIFSGYQIAPQINSNTIENEKYAGFVPIELSNCNENLEVTGNIINNGPGDHGIKLENCNATQFFNGLIANNMIRVGDSLMANGIWIEDSKWQNIYYNSVNITSSDTVNGKGVNIQDNNEEINIVNNIIANQGGGYALFVNDPTDISRSDHNGLFTTESNLVSWGGTDYSGLEQFSAASGKDENSLSVEPEFHSESDLHTDQISFMRAGTPLKEVKFDIDGHPRDTLAPDIGAMEFYCETPDFDIDVSVTCVGDTTTFTNNSTNITDGATYSWDFDGDYSPEIPQSTTPNETVTHRYDTAGSYILVFIVEQIEGCKDKFDLPVEVIAPPVLNIEVKGAYCDNKDGEAKVNVIDGEGSYKYYWSNGSTDSIAKNLGMGTYTVAVSDSHGCTSSGEITIEDAMEVVVTQIKSSTCGLSDGIAKVEVTGGVEPYRYVWSNGDTTAVDSTLAPGLHYVNVIDDNGCYARGSVVIEHDGSGPYITHKSTVHNKCFGENMGAIKIKVGGGSPPYDILWSNGSTNDSSIYDLPGGIYDVWVLDSDSCPTTDSYLVKEPPAISIGVVVEDASCLENDGRAGVLVSGGVEPYRYSWSTGGVKSVEENLPAGIHSVTVVDANECKAEKSVIVNNVGGPVISLKNISGVTCSDSLGGMIEVGIKQGTGNNWPFEWLWSPCGQTTPKITDLTIGTYEVKVTDDKGCTGFNVFEITEEPPDTVPICLVTVDSVSGKNMVVWEKADAENMLVYNVYREGSEKGDYQLIASISADELSQYIDYVADPSIRSWRYRLSGVDMCGNESELSKPHKTMHLTMNLGLDNVVNLIWDHYEGFPVDRYKIQRYDATSGWLNIANMPSDLTSRTDRNPPMENLTYFIEIEHPTGCTITEKKASTYNSSRSNRINRLKSQISHVGILVNPPGLMVYPNPGTGIYHLTLALDGTDNVVIRIFELTGKLLMVKNFEDVSSRLDTYLDLTGLASGIYHVQVKVENVLLNSVLIKE